MKKVKIKNEFEREKKIEKGEKKLTFSMLRKG